MKHWNLDKETLVNRYHQGESVSTICADAGIARSTFYGWIKLHTTTVTEAGNKVSAAELIKLKKANERLSNMVQVLQKVDCRFSAPPKEKLYALEKLYGQLSVHVLCDAFGVDRGTYYNHVLRNKKKINSYQARRDALSAKILEVYNESNQIFGANKIKVVLAGQGIFTSVKMVSALMQEMNLESIRLSAKKNYERLYQNRKKKDHLQLDFSAKEPNEIWVSDVTYFRLKETTHYICAIVDLYSRRVVAYKCSTKQSSQLVSSTFKAAYETRKPPKGLIFHSDRGSIYTSHSFRSLLQSFNVEQSFSPSGRPCHNAVMESFYSTLKKEELYRVDYRSINEFKKRLEQYIEFYNMKRPHSTLRFMTPNEYEERYVNRGGENPIRKSKQNVQNSVSSQA